MFSFIYCTVIGTFGGRGGAASKTSLDHGRFIMSNGHDEVPSDTLSASVHTTSMLKHQ
ncbi:hypothetical protein M422DRAFT_277149 [Sphaerobolus stellatus SS14]|uniref:Unplaced genomic scaffold SPHSTscaffold_1187, whole genome shotgun sequence n=1 Tax=Sphaerobolus stellatus (strain SS14) TaxID=990650 RepID=A0A0C9UA90_SPHS4|nr:hypothetical protein M422DRAFT_277149 [Sphaerobolus stellatus SS14]